MKSTIFENGVLYLNGKTIDIDQLTWNEHPTFKGVFLKHLITGADTNHQISYHLVKINPKAVIGHHNHMGKTETHEVLIGNGHCNMEGVLFDYQPGNISFIPADQYHTVTANKEGLVLLAKFFPALF